MRDVEVIIIRCRGCEATHTAAVTKSSDHVCPLYSCKHFTPTVADYITSTANDKMGLCISFASATAVSYLSNFRFMNSFMSTSSSSVNMTCTSSCFVLFFTNLRLERLCFCTSFGDLRCFHHLTLL